MKAVNVLNLATGIEQVFFGLTPEEAVKAAYLQSRGNQNTWTYRDALVRIEHGKRSVVCGDFAALRR